MPRPYDDPDFRYPNDNRLTNVAPYNYPSQGEVNQHSMVGVPEFTEPELRADYRGRTGLHPGYYANDNSGDRYANSNRLVFNNVDTIKQPPNSNYVPS